MSDGKKPQGAAGNGCASHMERKLCLERFAAPFRFDLFEGRCIL